jgi:hypothetical protein
MKVGTTSSGCNSRTHSTSTAPQSASRIAGVSNLRYRIGILHAAGSHCGCACSLPKLKCAARCEMCRCCLQDSLLAADPTLHIPTTCCCI